MKRTTLRFQLIQGFLAVIISMSAFLYYENYYAMKVVREEVSKSTSDMLAIHAGQIDRTLMDSTDYLYRMTINSETLSDLVTMTLKPRTDWNYVYAKVRIQSKLTDGLSTFRNIHAFFVYSTLHHEVVFSQLTYRETVRLQMLLNDYLTDADRLTFSAWQILPIDDQYYMVRVERATSGTLLGAIVRMNDIVESLRGLSAMEQWEIVLLDKQAQPLTLTSMPNETISAINAKLLQNPSHYQVFKNPSDGNKHLLVSMPFAQVPINLAVLIPEKNLLRQLPFFQIVIYLIPVVVGVVIAMYSVFLKKVLINPMNALIKGMRKVMKGDMEIRVPEAKTEELGFLIDTFNNMISQMRHLKISVYEEMLKAQQAEFKHLQAQINPHFYLNSLNVIYSLSLLEENELIRKMTEHLADYFRFITRSHRDTVWLEEETMHIRNYLEIQSLRFPEKLTYRIDVEESLRTHTILPLTIQPFVENAVIHGMEEGDVPFHIEIKVRTFSGDPRYFEVTIQDNGKGFDPNVLMQFNNKHFGDGTNAHMGIWNVFRRLRMTFGDRIEMKFMNRTPKGALVHLLIPMSDGEA